MKFPQFGESKNRNRMYLLAKRLREQVSEVAEETPPTLGFRPQGIRVIKQKLKIGKKKQYFFLKLSKRLPPSV